MSLAQRLLFLGLSAILLLFFGLAFVHQYDHHDHGTNCAVCQWLSNLVFILPAVFLFSLFLRKTSFTFSNCYLTPQLSSSFNSSRSPPF